MRNKRYETAAIQSAGFVRNRLKIEYGNPIGLVLGTGWGDKLVLENQKSLPFEEVPGFSKLAVLEGHERQFIYGNIEGKQVIALRGRIHLNEDPGNPEVLKMVRLQTETLMKLGVQNLIVTCAAGSLPKTQLLPETKLEPGNLVIINELLTLFAPQMPLWAGEFVSPEDRLTDRLVNIALKEKDFYIGKITTGCYAMVLGPFFEGRKRDKAALAQNGADIVGMSTLPEICVAALYPKVEVLALAFVTNDSLGVHSHESNMEKAKQFSAGLGKYLHKVITSL